MSTNLTLQIVVGATDKASNVVSNIAGNIVGKMNGVNPVLGMVGVGMTTLVVGAIAVGVASTKMAADYQQAMNMVQALTGSSKQQMSEYDASVKQLAVDAGVAPTELAKGLYNVLSASYKGADAMKVLTLATEDSKIGMTSATVTTDALTNILRSFGVQSKDITRTNGEMLQTVTLGKATFEQYATTIVKSASAANQFHVSMETMNAAWATMTSSGIRAAQASTDFQQSLKVMYGNIGTVTKSLHKNGIAFDQTKFNAMDYGHKVEYLNGALEQANQKHVKITGVTLQASQAISTISKHIGDYNSNLAKLSDKQAMAQKTQEAWKITQSGFNQTMDRVKASLDVLFITIGQQLLPVLTQVLSQVAPLIMAFTHWLIQSGALKNGLALVVSAIVNLVTTGAAIIAFFQHNQLAMDILIAVLAGVAGAILIFAATAIPALVAGFIAWAVAAGAAAVATLVAAAPFILIGLVIAAVVLGIILAVQHWGQISKWLQGVWAAFSSWFIGAMHAVGAFFVGMWNGIVAGVRAAWNFIVAAVKVGAILLLLYFTWPIVAIVALFLWLYNHNYYFKALIDFIINVVKAGLAWVQNAWNTAISWLVAKWVYLSTMAQIYWQMLQLIIQIKLEQAKAFIVSIWTTVSSFLAGIWSAITAKVSAMWTVIVGFFQSAWGRVSGPLHNLWGSITGFVGGWAAQAVQWGKNLIQGFIDGIIGMVGNVGSAVQTIMGKVAGFLGFHSPAKEGPGQHLLEWPRNMIKSYADEMVGQKAYLEHAVKMTIAPIAMMQHAIPVSRSGSTPLVSGGSSQTSNTSIVIHAGSADAREVARQVRMELDKETRRSGNFVTMTSGGRA